MTAGELKFALLVENVLNHIPQAEYRQLIVETLIVLTLLADAPRVKFLCDNLDVDSVLLRASDMFYQDEVSERRGQRFVTFVCVQRCRPVCKFIFMRNKQLISSCCSRTVKTRLS